MPGATPPQLPPDQLFTERCGSCHVLAAAGTAGATGPNLDEVLVGPKASPDFIREAIVDPERRDRPGLLGRHHARELRAVAHAPRSSTGSSTTSPRTSAAEAPSAAAARLVQNPLRSEAAAFRLFVAFFLAALPVIVIGLLFGPTAA